MNPAAVFCHGRHSIPGDKKYILQTAATEKAEAAVIKYKACRIDNAKTNTLINYYY